MFSTSESLRLHRIANSCVVRGAPKTRRVFTSSGELAVQGPDTGDEYRSLGVIQLRFSER